MAGIPLAILVTKVDLMSRRVKQDLELLFRSKIIQDQIERLSNITGVTPLQIFPIKNYWKEGENNDNLDRLLLYTLGRLQNMVDDFIRNHLEKD